MVVGGVTPTQEDGNAVRRAKQDRSVSLRRDFNGGMRNAAVES